MRAPKRRAISEQALNSQLSLTDVFIDKKFIEIGRRKYRAITLKTLPEDCTYATIIEHLTSLPFHFTVSQSIEVLDQAKERAKLELKRRFAHSMASGSGNVADLESESRLEQIEGLLTEVTEGSTKLVVMTLTVIVSGSSLRELDEKSDEVLGALRSMNQAEGLIETLAGGEAFFKALPGYCDGLRRHLVKSSNAVHLMPVFSLWKGNDRPICLIRNREGGLFSYDPFAKHLPNWNGLVFGGSGSGKSFAVAQLMLMFYGSKVRPRIVWIDNGASSKRLVTALGGEFIDLKLGSGISINLFDLPSGVTKPSPEKVKLILAVLELILMEEDQSGLPKRVKALLEEAIYRVYEKEEGQTPLLSDLRKDLGRSKHGDIRRLADILFSWTGDTAFGQILDRQTNVNLSRDLITFEVQSLNSHAELKNVVMLLLTSHINDLARSDRDRVYQLVIDEAERLLSGDSGKLARDFVVTCYRTWRKFKSSIICLSQNYLDFMSDKDLRDSLMLNTSTLLILRQKKIDWDHFQKTFDFNGAEVAAIKSLRVVKEKFSELFLLQDEQKAVLRLTPDPLAYWLCTSDADDGAQIAEMQRKNPHLTLMEVLESLATKRNGHKKMGRGDTPPSIDPSRRSESKSPGRSS